MNEIDLDRYDPADWPYGLSCMDCGDIFKKGQHISRRLVGMDMIDDEPVTCTEIICLKCSLGLEELPAKTNLSYALVGVGLAALAASLLFRRK